MFTLSRGFFVKFLSLLRIVLVHWLMTGHIVMLALCAYEIVFMRSLMVAVESAAVLLIPKCCGLIELLIPPGYCNLYIRKLCYHSHTCQFNSIYCLTRCFPWESEDAIMWGSRYDSIGHSFHLDESTWHSEHMLVFQSHWSDLQLWIYILSWNKQFCM
jgi:hypothetical protein